MPNGDPQPDQKIYANGEKFYLVELDQNGKPKIVGEIDPEKAVPSLVANYLGKAGQLKDVVSGADASYTGSTGSEREFANNVIIPAFNLIGYNTSIPFGERIDKLHKMFGDDPAIISIVARYVGENEAEAIWKVDIVSGSTQNYQPASQPASQPANVIQNSSRTQGQGPMPPAGGAGGALPGGSAANGSPTGTPGGGAAGAGTASSPKTDSKTGGDPMVLFSGQVYHQVVDLEVKGRGLSFSFKRTYLNQTVYKGPLGYNWDHVYNLWLREAQETLPDGTLQNVVYRSTGQLREDRYVQDVQNPSGELPPLADFADAVFNGPPGFFERLEKAGGSYILETAGGIRYEYGDNLYVKRIVDLNGNTMTFDYDNFLLTRITDPVGKQFTFQYDSLNRIALLVDHTGNRSVRYFYGNNGDLEEVDLVLAPNVIAGTDYRYSGSDQPFELQHNLVEIISPAGESVLDNEYGSEPGTWGYNRVVWQRSADGEFSYEYGPVTDAGTDPALEPFNVPLTFTRVYHPNGHCVEHWFNRQGNVVRRLEQVLGADGLIELLSSRYRYNEDGLLVSEVRPDGAALEFHYQREAFADRHGGDVSAATAAERLAFGNALRRVERPRAGFGEARNIVVEYTYQAPGNRVASQTGPYYADAQLHALPGQTIGRVDYEYDARGNLVKIRYPEVERPDGTRQTIPAHEFVFDARGNVIDVIAAGVRTHYSYFEDELRSGFVQSKVEDADGLKRQTSYEVDGLGRVTRITDYYGAVTEVEWTAFDTPARVVMPEVANGARPAVSYTYNKTRQPVQVEEDLLLYDGSPHPDGALVQSFQYDAFGRVVRHSFGSRANPQQRIRKTKFHPAGVPEKEIDFPGNITLTRYDQRMLVAEIVRAWDTPDQTRQRRAYNRSGELIAITDGRGFRTTIERDAFGRSRRLITPDGSEIVSEYDAVGRVTRRQLFGIHPETAMKVRWSETEYRYDAVGRRIEQVQHLFIPGSQTPDTLLRSRSFFDARNRLEKLVDAQGAQWTFEHDGLGRLVATRDPDGNQKRWLYDDANRTITTTETDSGRDESGARLSQVFRRLTRLDQRGLAVEEVDALGNSTRRAFDSRKLLGRLVQPDGREFVTEYNVFGQPVRHGAGHEGHAVGRRMTYDVGGRLASVISPAGGVTNFAYDHLDRVIRMERGGAACSYGYDTEGHLVYQKDENGIATRRTYTPAGLLRNEEFDFSGFTPPPGAPAYQVSATPSRKYKYTPFGSLASGDNDNASIIFRYDSLNRIIEELTNGRSIKYGYDAVNQRVALTFPTGRIVAFDFSAARQLNAIRQSAAGAVYPGDAAAAASRPIANIFRVGARPVAIRFGAAQQAAISYDAGRRVAGLQWTRIANGGVIATERNLFGNRGELKVQQLDGSLRHFEYDDLVRLAAVKDFRDVPLLDISGIGPVSSEVDLPHGPSQLTIDTLVRRVETAVGSRTAERSFKYELDDNGNRLLTGELLAAGGAPATTIYVPDSQDRFETVDGVAMVYDRCGNLLRDGRCAFRYDAANRLAEVDAPDGRLQFQRDAIGRPLRAVTGGTTQELVYAGTRLIEWRVNGAVEGQLVPLERPNQYAHLATGGKDSFPVFNASDSILAWVSADGTVIARSFYDPFGQVLERGPGWPLPFGFAGYWQDSRSGIYELAARSYHPRLGRFLQRDPAGFADGTNLYAYAHHAPGTLTDYWGLSSTDIDWGIVAVSAGKKFVTGALLTVATVAAVAAGIIEAPVAIAVGLTALATGVLFSWIGHNEEALAAHKTDWGTFAESGLAAVGDIFGATDIYEGATGTDVISDRVLGTDERSNKLGGGIGTLAVFAGSTWSKFRPLVDAGKALGNTVQYGNFSPSYALQLHIEPDMPLAEYFNLHNRPGSALAMGQYAPYVDTGAGSVGLTEAYGFRPMALKLWARTMGTSQIISDAVQAAGREAIVQAELPYMRAAEHIYFFRTGYEGPLTTRITWMELMEIYADPALRAKTSEIWLPENPLFKPVPGASGR